MTMSNKGSRAAQHSVGRRLKSEAGRQGGFTLLELLVVVVIIGLLAGYVAPKYFQQLGKSEVTVAKSQVQSLARALNAYRLDTGHYPSNEQGLNVLNQHPDSEPKWNGPYLENSVPADPWGNPYVYRFVPSKNDFEVISLGKDGKPGGEGEAADVSSTH